MSNINLTFLKYFFDAARLQSVSAAARENFISQSAISQGISKLEISLQAKLTDHNRGTFRLTADGAVIFEEAKRVFHNIEALKEKLCTLKGEISGNLHFACTNSLAQFFLPLPYLHMKQKYPKVKIQFHRGSLQYIHESLRTEKVSCALVLDARGFECYERHRLFLGSFRLYKKKDVPETAGVIIDHSENGEVIELQKRYQEHYGKELKLQDALSGWCLVLTFTLFGHGIGYLPDFMVQKKDDLQQVSLDFAPIEYAICLIKLKGVPLTKAESVFLDILKAHTANF